MKKYFYISLFLVLFFLASFFVVELFDIEFLSDPTYIYEREGILAAFFGVLLLVSDILIPVPSSVVMIANGAFFGIILGSLLTIIGGLLSFVLGYLVGNKSKRLTRKFISEEENKRARKFFDRWGMVAIIASRPIPILSETISILAGLSSYSFSRSILATLLGLLPASVVYSLVGVYALGIDGGIYSFLFVILIAGIFWGVGFYYEKKIKSS